MQNSKVSGVALSVLGLVALGFGSALAADRPDDRSAVSAAPAADVPAGAAQDAPASAAQDELSLARQQLKAMEATMVKALDAQNRLQDNLDHAHASHQAEVTRLRAEIARLRGVIADGETQASLVAQSDADATAELTAPPGETRIDPTKSVYPYKTPSGLRLLQIHFDPGSTTLTPGGLRKAREAADWITEVNARDVRVVGFTDTVGAADRNRVVAMQRAESVAAVLIDLGIGRNQISLVAQGESGPQPETTADQVSEPLNRAVGIFVISTDPAKTAAVLP